MCLKTSICITGNTFSDEISSNATESKYEHRIKWISCHKSFLGGSIRASAGYGFYLNLWFVTSYISKSWTLFVDTFCTMLSNLFVSMVMLTKCYIHTFISSIILFLGEFSTLQLVIKGLIENITNHMSIFTSTCADYRRPST